MYYDYQQQEGKNETVSAQPEKKAKVSAGAVILAAVGGVFILIAIALLCMNYMNGSVLEEAGMWAAVVFTVLLGAAAAFFSRRKNSVIGRILGMAAAYACILGIPIRELTVNGAVSRMQVLVMAAVLLGVNILFLALPVKTEFAAIHVTHMAMNAILTVAACFLWEQEWYWDSFAEMWQYPVFVAVSVLVTQGIFIVQVLMQEKQGSDAGLRGNMAICVTYVISTLIYEKLLVLTVDFADIISPPADRLDIYWPHRLVCAAVILFLSAIPFLILRKRREKWFSWYLLCLLTIAVYIGAKGPWELPLCLTALLAVSKLLSFGKDTILIVGDVVLTTYVGAYVCMHYDRVSVLPLAVMLIFSVPCITAWKTYYATVLTYSLAVYTALNMLDIFVVPVFAGVLFVGILIFNRVERWQDTHIRIYNGLILAGQACAFLALLSPIYYNTFITYLCMLIFGLSTITLWMQERYQPDFKGKRMILFGFLTYMAFILRIGYPIVNSILLMTVALVCLVWGFVKSDTIVRIYGLALSLAVCGKVALFDFRTADILRKTLVFFIVGVLVLAIAAVYMKVEKKQTKNQNVQIDGYIQRNQGDV